MAITRLNHAVLYVRNLERTQEFYENVLGFRTIIFMPEQAAFLQASGSTNDHDLGIFQIGEQAGPSQAGRSTVGLYHLAWEVDTLAELARIRGLLQDRKALLGASDHVTTKALYAQDPDGIEFEVSWLLPLDLIDDGIRDRLATHGIRPQPLDLAAEIQRYGAQTLGGLGVSIPL
jgi:catechol-2,3-dioxygenase